MKLIAFILNILRYLYIGSKTLKSLPKVGEGSLQSLPQVGEGTLPSLP